MNKELNKKDIINILHENFNFEIVETDMGSGIKMDPKEAFIFSLITGSGYLENLIFPFTPKGLMKIFYSALNYKFVSGLYLNSNLHHTPYYLNQSRQYLFDGDKIIVPVEFDSEVELKNKLVTAYGNNTNQNDIILLRVETYKNGNGLESFMEYLTCKYYNSLGYITENQIPLSHNVGSPDFGGYLIEDVLESISDKKILPFGFNIIELAMIRLNYNNNDSYIIKDTDLVVGEAKTTTSIMQIQLDKYLKTGFFNHGIEIHPFKHANKLGNRGIITIENNKIKFVKPKINEDLSLSEKQNKYIEWLKDYFKFYILCNYSNDELSLLFQNKFNQRFSNQNDIVRITKEYSISEHLNILLEYMKNGSF